MWFVNSCYQLGASFQQVASRMCHFVTIQVLDFSLKKIIGNAQLLIVSHSSMPHMLVYKGLVGATHNGMRVDHIGLPKWLWVEHPLCVG
jgi:hypothetical protein